MLIEAKLPNELTLEILDKAIDSIKAYRSNVVGLKVNPDDLRRNGTMSYYGIDSIVMIPPYRGLCLEPDINQLSGYIEPIRHTPHNI